MTKVNESIDLAEDEYVVSRIAGRKVEGKVRYYLIEWDGYQLNENTWEEEANVYSERTIQAFTTTYKRQNKCKSLPKDHTQKLLLRNTYDPDTKSYYRLTSPLFQKTVNGVNPKSNVVNGKSSMPLSKSTNASTTQGKSTVTTGKVTTTNGKSTTLTTGKSTTLANGKTTVTNGRSSVTSSKSTVTTIVQKQQQKATSATTTTAIKKRGRDTIEKETESVNISRPVKEARIGIQNLALNKSKTFEEKIKEVKNSVEINHPLVRSSNHLYRNKSPVYLFKNLKCKVTVVNEVDKELPTDFIYVDQLKYTAPVQPPDPDFLPGCQCVDSDCSDGCHDVVAYDKNGRLLINQGTAIYECNLSCECGPKCKNRVVQKGRRIPLQVFKTQSKGWGVRSNQFIPKGSFIEEYIGEVIKVEEGDSRGVVYDKLGCSYLFDMDFAQSELPTAYVIDSYTLGNVSRFFNHSCSPNLEVYAVFYDSADNQMHRLAFFAKRDILKDEELCFDYNGRRDVVEDLDAENASRYSCHCNALECRKWIYH